MANVLLRIAECLERMAEEARLDRRAFSKALENMNRVVGQK